MLRNHYSSLLFDYTGASTLSLIFMLLFLQGRKEKVQAMDMDLIVQMIFSQIYKGGDMYIIFTEMPLFYVRWKCFQSV